MEKRKEHVAEQKLDTNSRPSAPESSGNVTCSTEKKENNAFQVDTGIIPQARLEDQASAELAQLGLSVFNQDVFEQGIMDQVDQAFAKEEEQRLRKILQRELTAINDDIVLAKKDLERVKKAEWDLESKDRLDRESARQLEAINKQKQNKLKQLSTLKVRRDNVNKKLKGFGQTTSQIEMNAEEESVFDQAFDMSGKPKQESKREQMIRTGQMTPFGTVVKTGPTVADKPKSAHMSEFEKQLMAKESQSQRVKKDFSKYLKKKKEASQAGNSRNLTGTAENAGSTSDPPPPKKRPNRFDERDWRVYNKDSWERPKRQTGHRVYHEFHGDNQLSDEEEWNRECDELMDCDDLQEEEEYRPSKEEMMNDSTDNEEEVVDSDDEYDIGKIKRSVTGKIPSKRRKRPRRPPKYRGDSGDEGVPVRVKVKRDLSIRRERDDADPEDYQDRLLRQQKLEAREEEDSDAKTSGSYDEDDDDSGKFDGGLRVPPKLWKKLYKYQKTGVRWLWELHTQQAGGIVGDEMGLGKTIQTIAFLAALRTSKVKNVNFPYKGLGPTIIVCPTTVMHQWLKECHKWWPEFRVAILHSSGSFSGSQSELVRSIAKSFGILITSYSTLVLQQETILRFNWHYIILDEGHKIRNPDAKVTLCCKQFRTPHRIVLSGSPIQNNLKELWSLFDFVFPGKLGTLPDFMQHFSVPIVQGGYSNATQVQVETAYRCACVLRDTINPYLIRRMKADVKQNLNLPGKNEQVLFCRLTEEQRNVYQEYLGSRECNAILRGQFQVFAGLIMLRKICNHPDLSTGGLQLFNKGPSDAPEDQFGHYSRSGKMVVVEALLRLWKKQGHRVLLFTQSKSMLNILEKFVQDQGYPYLTMDGSTSISARQPLIDQYNKDPSIYIFLLTTRVGGLGVNLTGADRVIIFDPDWNPSTDMQARERAWRIGQQRQVTIYRLLTSGSIEEKIYHRQIFKQFLTNRILKDPKQRRLFKSQDLYELFTLGTQDNDEGTETSALFAGTGSDVRVPSGRRGRNRFDELQEQRDRERGKDGEEEEENVDEVDKTVKKRSRRNAIPHRKVNAEENPENCPMETAEDERRELGLRDLDQKDDEEEEDGEGILSCAEIERMKEFARMLSRKMESEKKKKSSGGDVKLEPGMENCDNVISSVEKHSDIGEKVHGEIKCEPRSDSDDAGTQFPTSSCSNMEHAVCPDNPLDLLPVNAGTVESDQSSPTGVSQQPVVSMTNANDYKFKGRNARQMIPHSRKDVESKDGPRSSKERKREEDRQSKVSEVSTKDAERERRKQRKRKKHRDARFEGERIPHLVKHRPLAKSEDADSSETQSGQQDMSSRGTNKDSTGHDDYVLRELFKKTGIQGAMKHDKIMDSGRPDYAIVEAEAEKVAREAVAALRRSRQRCLPASAGQPTWTGQHGAVSKPRFGQKKNSLLVGKSGKAGLTSSATSLKSDHAKTGENQSQEARKEKLFDGSISGNVSLSSKSDSLSSNDLLSRIQSRKHISAQAPTGGAGSDDDDDFLRPDIPTTGVTAPDPKDEELLRDIRDYVSFMASTSGEATSQEIVLNFGSRLPPADAPKFKAMLQQICELQPGGVWRLKAEFR